jgi:hypothetical protein
MNPFSFLGLICRYITLKQCALELNKSSSNSTCERRAKKGNEWLFMASQHERGNRVTGQRKYRRKDRSMGIRYKFEPEIESVLQRARIKD